MSIAYLYRPKVPIPLAATLAMSPRGSVALNVPAAVRAVEEVGVSTAMATEADAVIETLGTELSPDWTTFPATSCAAALPACPVLGPLLPLDIQD